MTQFYQLHFNYTDYIYELTCKTMGIYMFADNTYSGYDIELSITPVSQSEYDILTPSSISV